MFLLTFYFIISIFSWDYTREIIIDNSGGDLGTRDVAIYIDTEFYFTQGWISNDCSEMQIFNNAEDTPYDMWLEYGCVTNGYSLFWVTIPVPSGQTILKLKIGTDSGSFLTWNGTLISMFDSGCPGAFVDFDISNNLRFVKDSITGGNLPAKGQFEVSYDAFERNQGTGGASRGDHTHAVNGDVDAADAIPSYYSLHFCSLTTGVMYIETGSVDLFTHGTFPSDYTEKGDMNTYFLYFESGNPHQETNGRHNHLVDINSDLCSAIWDDIGTTGSSWTYAYNHRHPINQNCENREVLPPYYYFAVAENSYAQARPVEFGTTVMVQGEVPQKGYSHNTDMNGHFVRCTTNHGQIGGPHGNANHNHDVDINNIAAMDSPGGNVALDGQTRNLNPIDCNGQCGNAEVHNHDLTVTTGNAPNDPPFFEVFFVEKLSQSTLTINIPECLKAAEPCSGAGTCSTTTGTFCGCNSGFFGDNCENCYDAYCNGVGTCSHTSGTRVCACQANFNQPDCSTCDETSVLCNSKGLDCTNTGGGVVFCNCEGNFTGDNCEFCSSDDDCNSHSTSGVCDNDDGTINCNCEAVYTGPNCENWFCGQLTNIEPGVCSDNGNCDSPNNCVCNTGYYPEGVGECNNWDCFGESVLSGNPCNGGTCISPENCTCLQGYYDDGCLNWNCGNYQKDDAAVCNNQKGTCDSPNVCQCTVQGYYNDQDYCDGFDCDSISHYEEDVCNYGSCTEPEVCVCVENYYGEFCIEHVPFLTIDLEDQTTVLIYEAPLPLIEELLNTTIVNNTIDFDCSLIFTNADEMSTCTWVFNTTFNIGKQIIINNEDIPQITTFVLTLDLLTSDTDLDITVNNLDYEDTTDTTTEDDDDTNTLTDTTDTTDTTNTTDTTDTFENQNLVVYISIGASSVLCILFVFVCLVLGCLAIVLYKPTKKKLKKEDLELSNTSPKLEDFLSDYQIDPKNIKTIEQIGFGSSSIVYKAVWENKDVCYKLFKTISPNDIKDLENEARLMLESNHPNVVRLFGICIKQNRFGLIMELMKMGTLKKVLKEKTVQLSWGLKWIIAYDISLGIKFLHGKEVVHRDIKTDNVLIHKENNETHAKIADLGLSKKQKEEQSMTLAIGTYKYMAPEMSRGDSRYDIGRIPMKPVDIYAYAMVCVALFIEKEPYSDKKSDMSIPSLVGNGDLYQELPVKSPPELVALVNRCRDLDLEKRPTAEEIVKELEEMKERVVNYEL